MYATDLSNLCQGHALWVPEPGATGEVHLGDVGYVDHGAFVRLLNVRKNDPKYEGKRVKLWRQVLENFEALPEEAVYNEKMVNPIAPGRYPSHGVEQTSVDAGAQG